MKILAGLGNPGKEYESTPHSIGFEVVDAVAREMSATFKKSTSFKGELADGRFANGKLMVLKPMTFMNLSGDSVAPVVKYHNATPADLVVVSDDIDLPVGRIRIRKGGSGICCRNQIQLFFSHGSMGSQSGHNVNMALVSVELPDDFGDTASLRIQPGVIRRKQQETLDLLAAFLNGGNHQFSEFAVGNSGIDTAFLYIDTHTAFHPQTV